MLSKVTYILALTALSITSACNEEDSPREEELGGCEITLNGGPYNNSTYATDETAMPVYIAEADMNVISFYGEANGQEILVRIMYPGKSTGRLSWTEETCYVSTSQVINGEVLQGSHVKSNDPLTLHSGYVEVLRYDEKAGIITGTFAGDYSYIKVCEPEPCIEVGTIEGSFAARMS
ncbi:MAG TPA: hypothetical protein VFT90_06820 [Chryseosolibacter sp.]|nr:hypothetical protein [Chryseosolibacter sp.]